MNNSEQSLYRVERDNDVIVPELRECRSCCKVGKEQRNVYNEEKKIESCCDEKYEKVLENRFETAHANDLSSTEHEEPREKHQEHRDDFNHVDNNGVEYRVADRRLVNRVDAKVDYNSGDICYNKKFKRRHEFFISRFFKRSQK